jgi:hypothetical protein
VKVIFLNLWALQNELANISEMGTDWKQNHRHLIKDGVPSGSYLESDNATYTSSGQEFLSLRYLWQLDRPMHLYYHLVGTCRYITVFRADMDYCSYFLSAHLKKRTEK